MAKNQAETSTVEDLPVNSDKRSENKSATDKFGDFVDSEIRSNEIDDGLSEIYQDENGKIVDMTNAEIEHGHTFLYRAFVWLFNVSLLLAIIWAGYYYFYQYRSANDTASVAVELVAPKEIIAGEEFDYVVTYKNLDKIDLKSVELKMVYPENFIFTSAEPKPTQGNEIWIIGDLAMRRSGELRIHGRLIGEVGKNSIALATMTYFPANFSSQFKKDASADTVISSTGLDFTFDFPESVLVDDENELYIKYTVANGGKLDSFRLKISKLENLSFGTSTSIIEPGVFNINLASTSASTTKTVITSSKSDATSSSQQIVVAKNGEIRIPLIFTKSMSDIESLALDFSYTVDNKTFYSFFKKEIKVEVLAKSINLDMLINGSKIDQGVDFGQTMSYSVTYANKGDQPVKNLVVMAVLDSDFLDWQTLSDKNKGAVRTNKISWSKDQISELALLKPGEEGTIDFSINVVSSKEINPVKSYQIKSYARFTIGDASSTAEKQNDRSNEIVNKINSDLSISESVRYFNDDNIAVGSGPQPPKVGEMTSYKVFWKLSNSLNELDSLKVETTLPSYVNFDAKNVSDVGTVVYDQLTRNVSWNIGKLPIVTTKAEAEFSINVTPTTTDANRIMILLSNTKISAVDSATKNEIMKTEKAKTTKLVDDPAITDDGRISN